MRFDELLQNHIGGCGNYQVMKVVLFLYMSAPIAFSIMELVFIFLTPTHWCKSPSVLQMANFSQQDQWILTSPGKWVEDRFEPDACLAYVRNFHNNSAEQWQNWLLSNSSDEPVTACKEWDYAQDEMFSYTVVRKVWMDF